MPNTAKSGEPGRLKSLSNRIELPAPTMPTTMHERIPALPTIKLKGILLDSHQPMMSLALVSGTSRAQRVEDLRRANRLGPFSDRLSHAAIVVACLVVPSSGEPESRLA